MKKKKELEEDADIADGRSAAPALEQTPTPQITHAAGADLPIASSSLSSSSEGSVMAPAMKGTKRARGLAGANSTATTENVETGVFLEASQKR